MEIIKTFFRKLFNSLVLYLIIGIVMLLIAEIKLCNEQWSLIFYKISEILLIGGLCSFLLSANDFIKVYRKTIEDVIYNAKHLRRRSDIEDIWKNVSKEMFKSVLPQLSDKLLTLIKGTYLPEANNYYHKDYSQDIDITYDEKTDIITTEFIIKFKIISEGNSKKQIKLPLGNTIDIPPKEKDNVSLTYEKIMIDGSDAKDKLIDNGDDYQNGSVIYSHNLLLSGKKEYDIYIKFRKEYLLRYDNYIAFYAKWLVDNMEITVNNTTNLNVVYIPRGTSNDFKTRKKTSKNLILEYKGLILRKQGYILTLNKCI